VLVSLSKFFSRDSLPAAISVLGLAMQQPQNVSAALSSVNNPIFQPLKVLISESAILSISPCMGPMFTIEHGVPKEVAEAMVVQIIQEFAAGCKSLSEDFFRAKAQIKVELLKNSNIMPQR
jgi:hypothetical protein